MAMDIGNGTVRVLIAEEEVERRVGELAREIARDYRAGREAPPAGRGPLVCVGVLKGSVFFLVDLLKRLEVPVAVDFLQTSSYGEGTSPGEVRFKKDLDLAIRGRDVLLVEDIVDTGHTLNTILALLRLRGAASVKLCALLDKAEARQVPVAIDYCGFTIPNHFVVGYGLDVGERFRNLRYVGVWEPLLSEKSAEVPSPS
jgi:hypoxanthine phosphoribosyltransferase